MAPDLNTMPESPRINPPTNNSSTHSRRSSHMMTGTPLFPSVTGSGFGQSDEGDVPMRHPRPLTTAELHLEMEKEQEAAVNRLARELSALRAQHSASVASNASSATSSALDTQPTPNTHPHPTATPTSTRHRSSSSSLSIRDRGSMPPPSSTTPTTSQASVERARDAAGMRSRENSLAGGTGSISMPITRSRAPSASPSPQQFPETYFGGGNARSRTGSAVSSGGWEEAERARAMLESARRENEMLVARVRELEGLLRESPRGTATHRTTAGGEGKGEADRERDVM